jgi:hypothetical protein
MYAMPNEFALSHSAPCHLLPSSAPAIGWKLLLGMAPVLLIYWLLLPLMMLGSGIFSFARRARQS